MYRSNKELFVGLYWIQKILYQINIVKFNLKAKYHPHPPPANTIISRTHSLGKFLGPLRVFKTYQNSNPLSVIGHASGCICCNWLHMFLNPDLNILISLVAMYTNYVCYKTFNICNYMHEHRFIEVLHVAYCFSSYCICSFFAQIW